MKRLLIIHPIFKKALFCGVILGAFLPLSAQRQLILDSISPAHRYKIPQQQGRVIPENSLSAEIVFDFEAPAEIWLIPSTSQETLIAPQWLASPFSLGEKDYIQPPYWKGDTLWITWEQPLRPIETGYGVLFTPPHTWQLVDSFDIDRNTPKLAKLDSLKAARRPLLALYTIMGLEHPSNYISDEQERDALWQMEKSICEELALAGKLGQAIERLEAYLEDSIFDSPKQFDRGYHAYSAQVNFEFYGLLAGYYWLAHYPEVVVEPAQYAAHFQPENPAPHLLMGDAFYEMGDPEAGKKAYTTFTHLMTKIDPHSEIPLRVTLRLEQD